MPCGRLEVVQVRLSFLNSRKKTAKDCEKAILLISCALMETKAAFLLFLAIVAFAVMIGFGIRNSRRAEEERRKAQLEIEKERRERLEAQEEMRKAGIRRRFGEDAERIISQTIWVGETEEQLRASLGDPLDVDQKVLKSKRREIWKYGSLGGNRYKTRITLEDGLVSGWDVK